MYEYTNTNMQYCIAYFAHKQVTSLLLKIIALAENEFQNNLYEKHRILDQKHVLELLENMNSQHFYSIHI